MKQLITIAAVVLVGCSKDTPETSQAAEAESQVVSKPTPEPTPVSPADEKLITDPIVEDSIRKHLAKPKGELTEEDLKGLTKLSLTLTKTTDEGLKEVAKLKKLRSLFLYNTQVTDAGVAELKKVLPKCKISGP